MTDTEINDEIMCQLGWEFRCGGWRRGEDGYVNALDAPDFAGSLDAMHEVEATLSRDAAHAYHDRLMDSRPNLPDWTVDRWTWHATARQRAEAFLRVKGAWIE